MDKQSTQKIIASKSHWWQNKKIFVYTAVVILVGLIGFGGYSYINNLNIAKTQKIVDQKVESIKKTVETTANNVETMIQDGKVSEAVAAYDKAITKINKEVTDNNAEVKESDIKEEAAKYIDELLAGKAAVLLNDKQYDQSLIAALEYEKSSGSSDAAQLIAEIYALMGNNDKAIEYFNKAIGLLDPNDELDLDEIDYCNLRIAALKGI